MILGIVSAITTVNFSESVYALIVVCLLPLNSILNPFIHSTFDINLFFLKKKEKEIKKRIELVKEGKEQVFNQFLNFLKLYKDKQLMSDHDVKEDELFSFEKLFNKNLYYYVCCLNIISALAFCHQNQLSFEKNLSFELIAFHVRLFN